MKIHKHLQEKKKSTVVVFDFFSFINQAKLGVVARAEVGWEPPKTCHHFARQHPWGGRRPQGQHFLMDRHSRVFVLKSASIRSQNTQLDFPVIQDTTDLCRIHHCATWDVFW